MLKKKIYYLLVGAFLLCLLAACGESEDESVTVGADTATLSTIEDGKLTFGSSGLYKPMNYEELDGEKAGFEIDLGNALAEEMGLEPNPVFTQDFGALIEEVNNDRLDVILGSLTITDERAEVIDFSDPYYVSGGVIYVHEDTDDIKSLEDLEGRNVGVITASTFEDIVLEYIDEENLASYQSDTIALTDLAAGTNRLDAVMTDKLIGLSQIEEQDLPIKPVGDRVYDEYIGAGVKKGNKELLDEINRALEAIIENGTYEEISNKWFGENILE